MSEPHEALAPHRSVLILILGILSLNCLPVLGAVAWYLGSVDLRAIDEGRMDPSGRDLTRVGQVCGMVGTGILALALVGFAIFLVVMLGVAVHGTS